MGRFVGSAGKNKNHGRQRSISPTARGSASGNPGLVHKPSCLPRTSNPCSLAG